MQFDESDLFEIAYGIEFHAMDNDTIANVIDIKQFYA